MDRLAESANHESAVAAEATHSTVPLISSTDHDSFAPAPVSTLDIANEPGRLGHYQILGELGRGGMGIVYAAQDTKLDRKVAIKQVHTEGRLGHRDRLIREALAMARLSHPNVISIYEIGERGDTTFIVMEYIKGSTLRSWLKTPRTQAEILTVFKAAARGLHAAHQKGLVHRDFKPDNVMIDDEGRVRVMDFGLARACVEVEPEDPDADDHDADWAGFDPLTQTGARLGTPAYMSPEQHEARAADAASDQFSFCVALWEALHGARPFIGNTFEQLRAAVMRGEIHESAMSAKVPDWLNTLVRRGLALAPEDRFESMQALLGELMDGELSHDADARVPPRYVFVAHDSADKVVVLRLCEELLDLGVRPWLDMWELTPGQPWRAPLEEALASAPAVLVCHGRERRDAAGLEYAQALAARIERDPDSVYQVAFAAAPSPADEPFEGVELLADSWRDGVVEIARRVGIDHDRKSWLGLEAQRAGLSTAELSPYRGLEAFREPDARWMFGRTDEVCELLELIRRGESRFLTLVGASGSGKSSLLMAGVCPALRNGVLGDGRDWSIAYMRPGPRPCEALAQTLVNLRNSGDLVDDGLRVKRLRDELRKDGDTLRLVMSRASEGRVLLIIDQLEELFTEAGLDGGKDASEALAFVQNLHEATREVAVLGGRLWVVATLRADFVQRGLDIRPLASALKDGTHFALPPMSEDQLRTAIERPAARVGYRVEGKLVEKLVAAAALQAGRLPLLQHVLRELWLRRDVSERILRHSAYAETGGLEGAVAMAAERTLDHLREEIGEAADHVTRRVMTRLVHLGDLSSGDTRRRATADELGDDDETRRALDAFVSDARVLVAAEEDGVEVFEFAHEALLHAWTTLNAWLDADREALKLRQELARDAARRHDRGDGEYLWGHGRVTDARLVLAASMVELSASEREFLRASERAARDRTRRTRVGVVVVVVALVAIVLGANAWRLAIKAEAAKVAAEAATIEAEAAKVAAEAAQRQAEELRAQAELAWAVADRAHKTNERLARDLLAQMFQVALRGFIAHLTEGIVSGEIEIDESWTPLVERDGQVFAAANIFEKGRVVTAGHDSVLRVIDERGNSLFLEITVDWLLGAQARREIAVLSHSPERREDLEIVLGNLSTLGHEWRVDPPLVELEGDGEIGMLIVDNCWAREFSRTEIAAVESFVRGGGGLLAVGHGSEWLEHATAEGSSAPTLADYPMNALMSPFGVQWIEAVIEPVSLKMGERSRRGIEVMRPAID